MYSAPIAMALYATAFERANALDKLEAFASFNGPDFYGMPRNKVGWVAPRVAIMTVCAQLFVCAGLLCVRTCVLCVYTILCIVCSEQCTGYMVVHI